MPLESLDEPFRNPGQSDLGPDERPGQTGARHILASAVDGVENIGAVVGNRGHVAVELK